MGLLSELEARVAGAPGARAPAVLVHTDLNAGNLVATDGGVRLLDWEAARRGPAAWDLAHALSPTTTTWDAATSQVLGDRDADRLLDAYVEAGGSAAAVAQVGALMEAVVFRALSWCAGARAERGAGSGEPLDAALERLTRVGAVRDALAFATARREAQCA